MYLCFDWSNNCGEFFRRELVKSVLTILKRNISYISSPRNRHSFRLMEIRLKRKFEDMQEVITILKNQSFLEKTGFISKHVNTVAK